MSFTYLPEPEGGFSLRNYLTSIRSERLRLTGSLVKFCSNDKETGSSQLSLFGTTSAPSTETHGEDSWTLSVGASRAMRRVRKVKAQDLPAYIRDCGSRCSELLERYNLRMYSRKTARFYVPVDLAPSSKDLHAWGTTYLGACWELGIRVTPTKETGCGYWPTPTATDASGTGSPSQMLRDSPSLSAKIGGPIHPTFLEWLMGWPLGWTDIHEPAYSETGRYQQWLRLLGRS